MRKLFLIAFSLLSLHVAAQKELWNSGALVTNENEVLTGDILFYPMADMVVIRRNTVTKVLPASKIISFRFHDLKANINRKFVSLPAEDLNTSQKIYEIVVNGEISVLRRAKNNLTMAEDDEYYYYFVQNGTIESLKKFRSRLYPGIHKILADEEKTLRLNPNLASDAIRYIELYNQQNSILVSR